MTPRNWFAAISLLLLALNPSGFAEELALAEIQAGKVILPWTELKKLLEELETLKRNQQADQAQQAETLPVSYSITQARFIGEVKGNSVRFEAELVVQVLKTGWVTIPLFANDIGIEAANIAALTTPKNQTVVIDNVTVNESKPTHSSAAQLIRDTKGYHLLAQGPEQLAIQIAFYLPVQIQDSIHTLNFTPPRAVVNQILLRMTEKGITLVQQAPYSQVTHQDGVTTVESVLSERDTFQLRWQVKQDSGITRKSSALIQALASINKSDLTVLNTIILRHVTSLEQLAFHIPLNVEILNITSPDIAQWSTEKSTQSQVIKVAGHQEFPTQITVEISSRLRFSELPIEMPIPMITISGVDNLEGFLGIEVLGNLEVTTDEVMGGILIPAKNLPQPLWQKAANPLLYGYQFHSNTFSSSVSIKGYREIQTVVANADMVNGITHRTLEGKSITRILYFIRNNDRQFLTLTLPPNSRLWQAFLDGKPVKPAQKDNGDILIPMKKSTTQKGELQSFAIEIGYITEVNKLSLKGDILTQLPAIDIPISYLKWSLYLPEYYEYSKFEGPLKQVTQFSTPKQGTHAIKAQIDIPKQGQLFLFEKHLIVNEKPYVRGKYGQFLGDDIFLSFHSSSYEERGVYKEKDEYRYDRLEESKKVPQYQQQVIPNRAIK